jgi:hypothetical protein
MSTTSRRKPAEPVAGRYTPIPHAVLDSTAFVGASNRAKALLFDLLRQHTGSNNGHLQLSLRWLMRDRGWTSADQVQKAKQELLDRNLVIKTRRGGMGIGPDRYALTWIHITDFRGLDLRPSEYHPGAWQFLDPLPTIGSASRSIARMDIVPYHGVAVSPLAPQDGSKTGVFRDSPNPSGGNNECCQSPAVKRGRRVVGKAGASGIKTRRAATNADPGHESAEANRPPCDSSAT